MALQAEDPPFGGFVPLDMLRGMRVFMSPGPIWEPQGPGPDPWGARRALHAAGFKSGDTVVNTYAYHMTPGGFIMEEGARALGCTVFPAGPGNSEAQAAAIAALKPRRLSRHARLPEGDFGQGRRDRARRDFTQAGACLRRGVVPLAPRMITPAAAFPCCRPTPPPISA